MSKILDTINGHDDLLAVPEGELPRLAEEIRDRIVNVMPRNGGHFGSGLGITDLTIALHRVFDFRKDHFVLDVSHQCYPHKMLTGRRVQYEDIRQKGGPAGYTRPSESDYDRFVWAHAGTAISTAMGLAQAEKGRDRWAVAIVGDASIPTGVSLEALNHFAELHDLKLLVVLNDNDMSIAPTVGGLSKHLKGIKKRARASGMATTPQAGEPFTGNFFESIGHRYVGPIDGHDIAAMIELFDGIKNEGRATFVHVATIKGKGHREAEKDQWKWHAVGGSKKSANPVREHSRLGKKPYTEVFVDAAIERARKDKDIHALTAAMPCGTGLRRFAAEFPDRFYDTGIAEQHAVAFSAGMVKGGKKVLCAIYSTFLQRAYDQLFQEIALNRIPVTLCLDRAGIVGPDGVTHNGTFDIAYLRSLPHINILAPRDATELHGMIELAVESGEPCAIRYPRTAAPDLDLEFPHETPLEMGRSECLRRGRDVAILAYGAMVYPSIDAAELLEEQGVGATVVNARFVRPMDDAMLRQALAEHPVVVTVEEHALSGGFGAACLEHAARNELDASRIRPIGLLDDFVEHGTRAEMLDEHGLSPAGIARQVQEHLRRARSRAERPDHAAEEAL